MPALLHSIAESSQEECSISLLAEQHPEWCYFTYYHLFSQLATKKISGFSKVFDTASVNTSETLKPLNCGEPQPVSTH